MSQAAFVEPPWIKRLKKAVDTDYRLNASDKAWGNTMTSRMRIHAELEGKIRSHKHEATNLGLKRKTSKQSNLRGGPVIALSGDDQKNENKKERVSY